VARLTVVGDALLDRDLDGRVERLAPDAPVPVVDAIEDRPRAGGAGLAAALAAAAGHETTLVCALGADAAGRRLRGLLEAAGVRVRDLGCDGPTPEKVRVRVDGRPLVRLDLGTPGGACGRLTRAALAELEDADAVLVSDYGRGMAAAPAVRAALGRLPGDTPLVWDPHPRGPEPVPGALLVTPNASEAARFAAAGGPAAPHASGASADLAAAEAAGRALAARWRAVHVCVTVGARGALLVTADPRQPALAVPAADVAGGDACGAGDCFAATAAGRLAAGSLPTEAVRAAVAGASAFVAAGGAGAARRRGTRATGEGAAALAARVRAAGGTVVATGGCFDLLHAGHVRLLEAARALGDCLIVCLNSDDSVRRLKGSDRPVVGEDDRAAVLAGLGSVDAVAVFGEDDPRAVLRELRPHVWVKGGDYALADLPEREVLEAWGGQAVTVPYVAGRSTTRLIEELRTVPGV
jgi:rfaE bifunctional protein nucleotidyltransferase chain/domain/rfaE bifunctional protein kinase chain/domain